MQQAITLFSLMHSQTSSYASLEHFVFFQDPDLDQLSVFNALGTSMPATAQGIREAPPRRHGAGNANSIDISRRQIVKPKRRRHFTRTNAFNINASSPFEQAGMIFDNALKEISHEPRRTAGLHVTRSPLHVR